jgi:hypothetical protein
VSIGTIFKKTFQTFLTAPLLFLAVQIPQGIVDAADYYAEKAWSEKETLLMGLFALVAFVIGVVPSAITFTLTWKKEKSLKIVLNHFAGRWSLLLLSAIVSGVLFALGVMAYVIPGILLMTFYLFVPYLIITEPKMPLATYFYRSSSLTKKNFLVVLSTVIVALVIFVVFQQLGEMLGERAMYSVEDSVIGNSLLIAVTMLFSILINALVNIWLSHFYLELKQRS